MSETNIQAKYQRQAEMLANKVKKRYNHLRKRFARQKIDVYRLYDWDIPEIRAVVDRYAGHLVVAEYARRQSTPEWLPMMGAAAAAILGVPPDNLHLKIRRAGKQNGRRYERIDTTNEKMIVSERELRFYVNLNDYVDTGLFSDHRDTRRMVQELAGGCDFLNLYCYTGSFTCYAASGGARSTVSVDRSDTAITWARENLALNSIPAEGNRLIQADAFDFLAKAKRDGRSYNLAVVDPPSYSTTRSRNDAFDIAVDHLSLLEAVVAVTRPEGVVFFSTNHQSFQPRLNVLEVSSVREITSKTIPEDYQNKRKQIHRCWKIVV